MELASIRFEMPNETQVFRLYPLGDLHLGAPACDYAGLQKVIELIRVDPYARWIGMGDLADCIAPSDPRWTMRVLDWQNIGRDAKGLPDVGDLAGLVVNLVDNTLAPIWDKCIGLLEGNHEASFSKYYYTDLTRRLAKKHGVPFLGQSCLYRLEFVGNKWACHYDCFGEHGGSGGGTDGNALNNVMQRLAQFDADIYMKGHVHRKGMHKRSQLAWGSRSLRTRTRLMVLTGTFLHGIATGETTYSESKGMPPNEVGSMVVLIRPRQRFIEAMEVGALGLVNGYK